MVEPGGGEESGPKGMERPERFKERGSLVCVKVWRFTTRAR